MLNPQAIDSSKTKIQNLKDLVSRTVGVGVFDAALHKKIVTLLRKKRIDDQQIHFVNLGSRTDIFKAVRAGRIDVSPADLDVYADRAEYGVHILRDGNMWLELPEYTKRAAYTTTQYLRSNRDVVVRIAAAFARLYRFLDSPKSLRPRLVVWLKILKTEAPKKAESLWDLGHHQKPFPRKIALSPEWMKYIQKLNISLNLRKAILVYDLVADASVARCALQRTSQKFSKSSLDQHSFVRIDICVSARAIA
jgi:ABC-type nitrate/sulfonate/bicarbonate transport system substrate-binding protein